MTVPADYHQLASPLMRADSDDPLTRALAPPEDETAEAREARLRAEAEARRVSDAIDEQLARERAALKKRRLMKMLLLGQSESGMSPFIDVVHCSRALCQASPPRSKVRTRQSVCRTH